jgi:RNA polymerase sigma-70 factor (ECF subfamily)
VTDDINFQRVSAQIVATLTRILGPRHIALAEEVAQDALLKALQTWPHAGVPANPSAWLIQVAKNRALDALRRDQWLADRVDEVAAELSANAGLNPSSGARLRGEPRTPDDDQLAMMFLACHPVLPREARVALTLKTVCGFGVGEIARAFLAREDTIAQRLVRAKRQLRDADVAFTLAPAEYLERLESVLDVLYLLFNEGHSAHAGDDLIRGELCEEAIRLGRLLADEPALATPAVYALLALMHLQAARLPARLGEADEVQRLAEQDRSRWDRSLVDRGLRDLERAASGDTLTIYHVEAGIAACHAAAAHYDDTDWSRIVELYDMLAAIKPTPIVALNRAIALSRLHGPKVGLAAVEAIADDPVLARYYLLPATMGELARESGDAARAAEFFRAALACECSQPERRFLERKLREAETGDPARGSRYVNPRAT